MSWTELVQRAREQLDRAGVESPEREAIYLWEWATGRSYADWITWDGRIDEVESQRFSHGVARRCERVPMAYITGHREFYGLDLLVSPAVLIPRPDTEVLVDMVLQSVSDEPRTVVDVGTGSGAIALALKHHRPSWRVEGVDSSRAALAVAHQNSIRLGLAVTWRLSDLLCDVSRPIDVLVANLPYVARSWIPLDPEMSHEPARALYADQEGLALIYDLVEQGPRWLSPGGSIFIECGVGQASAISKRLVQAGFDHLRVVKDYAGVDRVVSAAWSQATDEERGDDGVIY